LPIDTAAGIPDNETMVGEPQTEGLSHPRNVPAAENAASERALCLYGALECAVGLAGLLLNTGFRIVEQFDSWAYTGMHGSQDPRQPGLGFELARE
jgi:hypothetical protein